MAGDAVETRDLVYSTIAGGEGSRPVELKLTLSVPKSGGTLPCFVYIHGGAWHGGNRRQTQFRSEILASGWAYASVDYRLNGQCAFPLLEQLDDCRAAVRFLQANAVKCGLDPKRICVAGGSAGGHLASLLAVTEGAEGGIVACVDLYGPTDLHALGLAAIAAERAHPGKDPRVKAACRAMKTSDLDVILSRLDEMSPVEKLAKLPSGIRLPRFLILHTRGDPSVPVRQSESFAAALGKSGADVTLKVYEGTRHSVPRSAAREVLEFLR